MDEETAQSLLPIPKSVLRVPQQCSQPPCDCLLSHCPHDDFLSTFQSLVALVRLPILSFDHVGNPELVSGFSLKVDFGQFLAPNLHAFLVSCVGGVEVSRIIQIFLEFPVSCISEERVRSSRLHYSVGRGWQWTQIPWDTWYWAWACSDHSVVEMDGDGECDTSLVIEGHSIQEVIRHFLVSFTLKGCGTLPEKSLVASRQGH